MPARAKAKPRVGVRRSQPPRPTGRLALYGIHALDTPCPQTMADSQPTTACYNPSTSSPPNRDDQKEAKLDAKSNAPQRSRQS